MDSNNPTPSRKKKESLPEHIAKIRRQKQNEKERVRQRMISQSYTELKSLNLPSHRGPEGRKSDSKIATVKKATSHIKDLRQQVIVSEHQENLTEQVIQRLLLLQCEQDVQQRFAKSIEMMSDYDTRVVQLASTGPAYESYQPIQSQQPSEIPVMQDVQDNRNIYYPEIYKRLIGNAHPAPTYQTSESQLVLQANPVQRQNNAEFQRGQSSVYPPFTATDPRGITSSAYPIYNTTGQHDMTYDSQPLNLTVPKKHSMNGNGMLPPTGATSTSQSIASKSTIGVTSSPAAFSPIATSSLSPAASSFSSPAAILLSSSSSSSETSLLFPISPFSPTAASLPLAGSFLSLPLAISPLSSPAALSPATDTHAILKDPCLNNAAHTSGAITSLPPNFLFD